MCLALPCSTKKVDNPIVFTIPDEKAEKPAEQPDDVAVRLMKEK